MKNTVLILIVFLFINSIPVFSQKPNSLNKSDNQNSIEGTPKRTHFNINNISTWVYANGDMDIKPNGNSGFEFPKGSGKAAIFESGLVWGGKIDGKVHVSGSTYSQGLLPGRILDGGTPQNPQDASARIYRVRPDYSYADLSSEVRDEKISYEEVYNNYDKDWNEWPGEWGAPFNDIDNNGIYNPLVDIPGVPGAHQTLWYAANDLDSATCRSLYGTDPMKVEFQVTIWGYNIPQSIYDNVLFKNYKLINKNKVDFDSMYISQWTDIDIGDAGDDFAGCDSLQNLIFCYNGDDDDGTYGSLVPAIGFQLLQGPIIKGADTDTAIYNNAYKFGYKNLEMKSHYFFIGGDPLYNDPDLGEYITGALQFYNLFKGKVTTTGQPFIDPVTNNKTKFTLSGNPFTKEGWIDGILHPPGDRRNGFTSGPFELAVGDTQEIVIAQFAEIGIDRLNSLLLLKESAEKLKNNYPNYINLLDSPISRNIYKVTPSIKQNTYSEYDIIELNIDRKDSIENFSEGNFEFQGYNIYQFSQNSDFSRTGQNIFTFDKVDDITTILGDKYDPILGTLKNDVIYNGSNSGFPERIIIDKDYILNSKLIKGKKYYYGITAYLYNEQENKTIETPPSLIEVIFQEDLPGAKYADIIEPTILEGNSDAEFTIEVVDPEELTGDTYEITFAEQHYYLDNDGEWKKTNYPDSIGKILAKPNDQTLSKLIPLPSIYATNGTLDLHFMVENNAPDLNFIDAITITFPDNIIINDANNLSSNRYAHSFLNGQTVTWKYYLDTLGIPSTDGTFMGGEELIVNINIVEPTFTVDYIIYDDGWSEAYAATDSQYFLAGAGTVNGYGSVKLTGEVGYHYKTVPYWRLTNKTTAEVKLEEVEIYTSYYSRRNRFGPESILDGFKIKLFGGIEPPINFSRIELNDGSPSTLTSNYSRENLSILNYTIFGGVKSSYAIDNFGVGTYDIDLLEDDYELRFTGVYDKGTNIDGKIVYKVIEGGQMATCFRMVSASLLATHPLNPSPGTPQPFLVKIPFEVWNVEDPDNKFQVNLAYRDRVRDGSENPFWAWNPNDRMYAVIVNSPYNPNQVINIDNGPNDYNSFATWVLVFYGTNYHLDDTVKVSYDNPIQFSDVYTFTMPKAPTDKISPNKYEIFQNYPNPFNPNTKIRYYIPEEGNVKITIYNILGQKITEVINKNVRAGKYETEFNGSNFASGVYIYRIEVDSPTKANIYSQTKKMMLLK